MAVFVGINKNSKNVLNSLEPQTFASTPTKITVDSSFFESQSENRNTGKGHTVQNQVPVYTDGISAEAYIVVNLDTGSTYIERNSVKVLPIASVSKLMTAITVMDRKDISDGIIVGKDVIDNIPDMIKYRAGEKFSVDDLMHALLLNSSNISAHVLASSSGMISFLENMSSKAWEIGMSSTFFADPSGLSDKNISSVKDLSILMKYLYDSRQDLLALTRIPKYSIATTSDHGSYEFVNTHPFVNTPGFIGGKTGNTPEAGGTLVTLIRINNIPVGIAVLGSRLEWRAEDTKKIIEKVRTILR